VLAGIRELDPGAPVRIVAAECPAGCPDECWIRYWPAMDLYGCAVAVVGGAGYNTVRECVAWGVPLIAKPWPRLYDRQDLRAVLWGRPPGLRPTPSSASRDSAPIRDSGTR